ncbi:hypothetical protein IQ06DRAFT_69747 [Phaeosphaeriaceae sp. SRC1lsM3a]|nr:hypothetical protein IQ06DRAFT_69747 [Stagonospora sp. SRC1lsM3a]
MLCESAHRGRVRLAWTSVCSIVLALLVATRKDPHLATYYHVWNPLVCTSFGISGAINVYHGIGLILLESKKATVEALQSSIEEDQLRESDRQSLSGWGWWLLQFTSLI